MTTYRLCPNCFSSMDDDNMVTCKVCGHTEQPAPVGKIIPWGTILHERYYIGKVLGIGGFGITYLAFDMKTAQKRAIKEYFPEGWGVRSEGSMRLVPVSENKQYAFNHGLQIFVEEAKILYGLQDNDIVVNVQEFFGENATAYLVMEYVPGMTLSQNMKLNKKAYSVQYVNGIIRQLAASLEDIHQKGLLHRDISPDNVMCRPDGSIRLIDFGATRQYVANEATDLSVLIKPGFAPLEQYSRNGNQGPWSDVYALASTYYYLVSGKKPYTSVDRSAGTRLPELVEVVHGYSKALSDVIVHAMELDYRKRTQSMGQFLREFDNACSPYKPSVTVCIQGGANGDIRKWEFKDNTNVVIGRNPNVSDICIRDERISGNHCEIGYDAVKNLFLVIDMSTNGTYVNGKLIGKGRYAEIVPGGRISLLAGKYQFMLEVKRNV